MIKLEKSSFKNAIVILYVFDNFTKMFSFFRQIIVATVLGFTKITDLFNFASNFILTPLSMISNAVLAGVIPFLQEKKTKDEQLNFIYSLQLTIILFFVVLFVFVFVFIEPILKFLAPGYDLAQDGPLIIRFIFFLFIVGLINIIVNTFEGYFRANQVFGLSNIVNLIASIVSTVLLYFFLSHQLMMLVYSQLIGLSIALIVYIMYLPKRFNKFDKDVFKLFKFSIPIIISSSLGIINNFVDRGFASTLPEGKLSLLTYSFFIVSTLGSIISGPIAGASFTFFSKYITAKEYDRLYKTTSLITNYYLIIYSLFFALFVLVGPLLLKFFFLKGQVNKDDIIDLYSLILIYLPMVLYNSLGGIVVQIYYSYKSSYFVTIINSIAIVIHIALNFFLVKYFGEYALAGSSLFSSILSTIIQIYLIKKLYGISLLDIPRLMLIFILTFLVLISSYTKTVLLFFFYFVYLLILFIYFKKDITFLIKLLKKV
ncbi:hypothetical protein BSNK01_26190 [Bacillaceae bacterium]